MECPICAAEPEQQDRVWYAMSARLNFKDPWRVARKVISEDISPELVEEHLTSHHVVQPNPPGKINRSHALQEALTSFPKYLFYLLRAIYRARALSEKQIYRMFYLDHAPDGEHVKQQMKADLQRLVFRNYLYRHWPENKGAMEYEDAGPYYFLNRQAIPLVERLEGLPAESLPQEAYNTALVQVEEFSLEHDARFIDTLVALRSKLYERGFEHEGKRFNMHMAIENWYSPQHLKAKLSLEIGEVFFTPAALVGLRADSRDGSLSALFPVWFEYDRGTEEPERVAESILVYGLYYGSEHYKETFPLLVEHQNTGPLICISETPYRRDEVTHAFKGLLKGRVVPVYFTDRQTFCHDPYAEGILTSPFSPDDRFSLYDRLFAHNQNLLQHRVFSGTGHLHDKPILQVLKASNQASGKPAESMIGEIDISAWQS